MAKNVKFGPRYHAEKQSLDWKKIKGTTRKYCKHLKGRSHKIIVNKKMTLNAWYHESVTIIFTI